MRPRVPSQHGGEKLSSAEQSYFVSGLPEAMWAICEKELVGLPREFAANTALPPSRTPMPGLRREVVKPVFCCVRTQPAVATRVATQRPSTLREVNGKAAFVLAATRLRRGRTAAARRHLIDRVAAGTAVAAPNCQLASRASISPAAQDDPISRCRCQQRSQLATNRGRNDDPIG
jgi:hypothetical protein